MRLVFLLYAEDEGLMPNETMYQANYSVNGLYQRLVQDAVNYPDTQDERYGAWAWLLSLVRLVYHGGGATPNYLPARHGQLFSPDEYPFLEGRGSKGEGKYNITLRPDGVIYRILDKLLILNGEKLSLSSLDVEQIGSVYEAIMGYTVEKAKSTSIGINVNSTTFVIDVAALVATAPNEREKYLLEKANCSITANALKDLKAAKTIESAIAAIERRVSS